MRGPAADVGCEAAIVALVGSLRDGLALRKHGRYGAPKLKHVFISDDGGHLLWGDKVCRARASSSSSSPSSSLPPRGCVVHRRERSRRRRRRRRAVASSIVVVTPIVVEPRRRCRKGRRPAPRNGVEWRPRRAVEGGSGTAVSLAPPHQRTVAAASLRDHNPNERRHARPLALPRCWNDDEGRR